MRAVRRHHAKQPPGHGIGEALNRFWDRPGVKPVAWTLAVLVWVPFLFVMLMVLGINPIFTAAVSKVGSKALKVPVKLQRASISFSGRVSLGRLEIQNPSQFSEAEAASIEGLYAEIPLRALFGHEIEIPVLTVKRPIFNLEMGEKKQPSNWAVLMKNLSESLPKKGEEEKTDGEKRFKIKDLKILNPLVRYRSPAFPKGIDLDLKDIELKQVGNAPGSSSKTYLVLASLFQALLTGGVKDKHLPSEVRGTLSDELGDASKAFGAAFQGIK